MDVELCGCAHCDAPVRLRTAARRDEFIIAHDKPDAGDEAWIGLTFAEVGALIDGKAFDALVLEIAGNVIDMAHKLPRKTS